MLRILSAAFLLALAPPAFAAAPAKLVIPYNSLSYDVAPLWMAIDEGLYRRYGLDVAAGGATQSPALVASVLSGERPVAISGPDAVVSADLNGADIVIIAAGPRVDFAVFATKAFHRVVDLKGKIIGITQLGTTHDFITRYVLRKAGLAPGDVTLMPLGQAALLPALAAGHIDGAVMQASEIVEARRLPDLNEVAQDGNYDLFLYAGSLIGKRSWLEAHRQTAMNLVRGYVAGGVAARRDRAAAIRVIAKYSATTDQDLLERGYDALVSHMPRVPLPEAKNLQGNLDESRLPAAKRANPGQFVDPSYVAELMRDGFIDDLMKPQE